MTGVVTVVGLVLAALVVVVAGVRAARDRTVERPELVLTALLEVAVVVYVVVRVVDLAGGHRVPNLAILVVYLVAAVLVAPVTALLAIAERSRWGPVVLAVGALVVCVLYARVDQLWGSRG